MRFIDENERSEQDFADYTYRSCYADDFGNNFWIYNNDDNSAINVVNTYKVTSQRVLSLYYFLFGLAAGTVSCEQARRNKLLSLEYYFNLKTRLQRARFLLQEAAWRELLSRSVNVPDDHELRVFLTRGEDSRSEVLVIGTGPYKKDAYGFYQPLDKEPADAHAHVPGNDT